MECQPCFISLSVSQQPPTNNTPLMSSTGNRAVWVISYIKQGSATLAFLLFLLLLCICCGYTINFDSYRLSAILGHSIGFLEFPNWNFNHLKFLKIITRFLQAISDSLRYIMNSSGISLGISQKFHRFILRYLEFLRFFGICFICRTLDDFLSGRFKVALVELNSRNIV